MQPFKHNGTAESVAFPSTSPSTRRPYISPLSTIVCTRSIFRTLESCSADLLCVPRYSSRRLQSVVLSSVPTHHWLSRTTAGWRAFGTLRCKLLIAKFYSACHFTDYLPARSESCVSRWSHHKGTLGMRRKSYTFPD